jgi:hypothetical protein
LSTINNGESQSDARPSGITGVIETDTSLYMQDELEPDAAPTDVADFNDELFLDYDDSKPSGRRVTGTGNILRLIRDE